MEPTVTQMKKLREEFEEFKELTGWSWRDTVMHRFAMLWTSYFFLLWFGFVLPLLINIAPALRGQPRKERISS